MSSSLPLVITRRRFTPVTALAMGLLVGIVTFFVTDGRNALAHPYLFGLGRDGSLIAVALVMILFLAFNAWSAWQSRYAIYEDRIVLRNWFFGLWETTILFQDLRVVGVHRNFVQRCLGRATLNLLTFAPPTPVKEDDTDFIFQPFLSLASVTYDALFGHGRGRCDHALYDLRDWKAIYTRLDDGLVAHHRRNPVPVLPLAATSFGQRVA